MAKKHKKKKKHKPKPKPPRPVNAGHMLSAGDTGRFRSGYNECPGCGGPKAYYAGRCAGCAGVSYPNPEARQKRRIEGVVNHMLCGGKHKSKAKREADPEWTCKQPAGWKTPHPGSGRCVTHGGMTPNSLMRGLRIKAEIEMREAGVL